jgi:hypothetical protein
MSFLLSLNIANAVRDEWREGRRQDVVFVVVADPCHVWVWDGRRFSQAEHEPRKLDLIA